MVANKLFGNRYLLREPIGQGGMGIVYMAFDQLTGQTVALKQVLAPINDFELAENSSDLHDEYFALAREFQTLASLRHPNIISVLDYGFHKETAELQGQVRPYFTMDLLKDASSVLRVGRMLNAEGRLYLLVQILQALDYLHRRGIIHRDLKPENILVINEQVKLLDFGLAMKPGQALAAAGTLPYMSPELLRGDAIATEVSDLYAVGIIAYELFAGRHPFNTATPTDLVRDILAQSPDPTPLEHALDDENEPEPDAAATDVKNNTTKLILTDEDIDYVQKQIAYFQNVVNTTPTNIIVPKSPLARIIFRLLIKDPDARYQKARDAMQDILNLMDAAYMVETTEIRESYLQAAKFVGREQQVAQIEEAIDQGIQGKGSAWLIAGESGVGKSRLIETVKIHALVRGALVLMGQGVEGHGLPYQYWRDIVRRLCLTSTLSDLEAGVLKTLVPDIDKLLQRPINDVAQLNSTDTKHRLISTIVELLKRQADPIVVFLEDLQWGIESMDVLKAVLDSMDSNPITIIASYRDDEKPDLPQQFPAMNLMRLPRLGYEDIASLSESILGGHGRSKRIVDLLQQETEGNVFFLIETVRALAEHAGQLSKIATAELPPMLFTNGIKDIVGRRLNLVPNDDKPLLYLAAIAGRQLDERILAHIVASDGSYKVTDLNLWLNSCASAAVLEVLDEKWRFSHDKVRQGVADMVEEKDRPSIHRKIALAIETIYEDLHDYAGVLAHHWHIAGNREKEAIYAGIAGKDALSRGSFIEAIDMIENAIALLKATASAEPDELTDLYYQMAMAYMYQGQFDTCQKYADVALELARQYHLEKFVVNALALKGSSALRQGKADQSKQFLSEGLELARKLGDAATLPTEADILMYLGALSINDHVYANATKHLEEAFAIATQIPSEQLLVARILNTQGENLRHQQKFEEATGYYQESMAIYKAIGHRFANTAIPLNLAHVAASSGNVELAKENFLNVLQALHGQRENILKLDALAGMAEFIHLEGDSENSVSLLGLVIRHPSTSEETRLFSAQPILDLIEGSLDDKTFKHAYHYLEPDDLDNVVAKVLLKYRG